jgi:hypothetical protein
MLTFTCFTRCIFLVFQLTVFWLTKTEQTVHVPVPKKLAEDPGFASIGVGHPVFGQISVC